MVTLSSKSPSKARPAKAGVKSVKNDLGELLRPLARRVLKAELPKHTVTIMERLAKRLPDAACELYYETPYQLLVSVVLSAQTTDKMVNKCMQPLYEKGFTPATVRRWGAEGLLKRIRTIGLAPTKSKNVARLTDILVSEHGGEVPNTRDQLEALPGVGKKTASVILGEIFGEPTLAVDTHVFRVSRRLGLHRETTPEKSEPVLLKTIPERYLPQAHHWLIHHGRYTCKAQKPLCSECVLADLCPSLPGAK